MANDLPGLNLRVVHKIFLVFFPCESYPPTANSCPFSLMQVKHFTGRSGIVCWRISSYWRSHVLCFHCLVSLVQLSPFPPATTKAFPLHMTALNTRFVGMDGKCSTHFHLPPSLATKLRSVLVIFSPSQDDCSPPTAVMRSLTTWEWNGLSGTPGG